MVGCVSRIFKTTAKVRKLYEYVRNDIFNIYREFREPTITVGHIAMGHNYELTKNGKIRFEWPKVQHIPIKRIVSMRRVVCWYFELPVTTGSSTFLVLKIRKTLQYEVIYIKRFVFLRRIVWWYFQLPVTTGSSSY